MLCVARQQSEGMMRSGARSATSFSLITLGARSVGKGRQPSRITRSRGGTAGRMTRAIFERLACAVTTNSKDMAGTGEMKRGRGIKSLNEKRSKTVRVVLLFPPRN